MAEFTSFTNPYLFTDDPDRQEEPAVLQSEPPVPPSFAQAKLPPLSPEAAVNINRLMNGGPEYEQPGVISGGLRAGWNQMQSGLAGFAGNIATNLNLPSLKQWADQEQDLQAQEALQYGRPDLENIRDQSLGTIAPFIGYQIAKQIPQWLPSLVTKSPAPGLALTGATGVGEMYGQAREAGIENEPGVAASALALGAPYAYLETLTPRFLRDTFTGGTAGDLAKRALTGLAKGTAREALPEAAQTGMEMLFRPDLSVAEKSQNIIDSALTGGLVGGTLGGVSSALSKKPAETTDTDLNDYVSETLGLPPPPDQPLGLPSPPMSPAPEALPAPETPPSLPPPALGLPAPAPPPQPEPPRGLFAGMDETSLMQELPTIEQAVKDNPADKVNMALLREIRGELDRRQAEAVVAQPQPSIPQTPQDLINVQQAQNFLEQAYLNAQPPTLFTEKALAERPPTPVPALVPSGAPSLPPTPANTVLPSGPTINLPNAPDLVSDQQVRNQAVAKTKDDIRNDLVQVAGTTKLTAPEAQWIKNLDAASRAEVANNIFNKINETGALNKVETKLAEAYGLIDKTGRPVENVADAAVRLKQQLRQKSLDPATRQNLEVRLGALNELSALQTQQRQQQEQQAQQQLAYDEQIRNLQPDQQASLLIPEPPQSFQTPPGQSIFNFDAPPVPPQIEQAQPPVAPNPTPPVPPQIAQDQQKLPLPPNTVSDSLVADYQAAAENQKLPNKVRETAQFLAPKLEELRNKNEPIPYKFLRRMDVVERALQNSPKEITPQQTMISTLRKAGYKDINGRTPKDEVQKLYNELTQTQGAQSAVQEPVATSVLSRKPTQVSGPMGEGDTQGTAPTTSLQQGFINEENSSQGYPLQEGGTYQKGSQESADQASVKAAPPVKIDAAQRRDITSIGEQTKNALTRYAKMAVRPQSLSVSSPVKTQPAFRSRKPDPVQALDQITRDNTISPFIRRAAQQAKTDPVLRDAIISGENRVTVIKNTPALQKTDIPAVAQRAWEASVRYKNPKIFDDFYKEVSKTVDLEKPPENIVYRRPSAQMQSQPQARMSVESVRAAIKPIVSNWPGLPEVQVVSENDSALSESDRTFLKQSKISKGLGAFTWKNGKPVLLLNSDKLSPRDVVPTLYHEALGHFGLRSAFGKELRSVMRDIHRTTPDMQKAVDDYINARPDLKEEFSSYNPEEAENARIDLVEEVLAEQSEKGPVQQRLVSRIKAVVQKFARKLGLRKGEFSPDEILSIVRLGQQAAMNPSKLNEYYLKQTYVDPALNQSSLKFVGVNSAMRDAAENAKLDFEKFLNSANTPEKITARLGDLRNKILPAMSVHHLKERYSKILPGLQKYYNALQERGANINHLAHTWASVHEGFDVLKKTDKPTADLLNDNMKYSAARFDPELPFNRQSKSFQNAKDPAELQYRRRLVAEANKKFAQLKTKPQALQLYRNYRTLNDMMIHSVDAETLYNTLITSKLIPNQLRAKVAKLDPMAGFQLQVNVDENSTKALNRAHDYFYKRADDLVALANAYLNNAYGEPSDKMVDPIKRQLQLIAEHRKTLKEYPYFHLGRSGDLMVSFDIRNSNPKAGGKPSSSFADRMAIQKALNAKGFEFELGLASNAQTVFLRLDSAAEQDSVLEVLEDLKKKGLIAPDKDAIRTGEKAKDNFRIGAQPWLDALLQDAMNNHRRQLQDIKESDMDDARKAEARKLIDKNLESIKAYVIDSSPATSIALVSQHRKSVPGYMSDMVRAGAYRAQVWTLHLANMSSRRVINDAMAEMQMAIETESARPKKDDSRGRLMRAVKNELAIREAIRPMLTGRTWHDTLAAWNHAYFLGLSPSYVVLQFTQLGVMLWPRLVQDFKNVSFLEAAKTIGKNTPAALQIVKAMIAQGKSQGAWNWADAPVTLTALNNTNLTKDQKEFVLRFVNRGNIDVGSAAREQGRVVEGEEKNRRDLALRLAASFGYYSEVATRLIAALSAYDLYKKANKGLINSADTAAYDKLLDTVSATVDGSMFNYNTTNTARFIGKMGFAGGLTKVMMTFYKYTASLLEALSRSVMDGFLGGADFYTDPVERAEKVRGARRFLAAHLTAMMMVSGSLGLPFTSAVASAINGLADLFGDDDEPYDAVVSWRNFLAELFGKDAEKVLSKGLGRLAGVDFSQRTSEADIIPFTKMLSDRREWSEASKDWAASMFGSPLSMATNILDGGSKFMDGNYLDGAMQFMPSFLKGPAKAADMYMNGYVDKKDNRYPDVSPGANDILKQAFGFTPSNIQDVKDKDRYYAVRQGQVTDKASSIRRNLAVAMESKNTADIAKWTREAKAFEKATGTDIIKNMPRVLTARKNEREGKDKSAEDKKKLFSF